MFPKFKISIFEICLHPINFNFTLYFLTSLPLTRNAGKSQKVPLDESELSLLAIPIPFQSQSFIVSGCVKQSNSPILQFQITLKTESIVPLNSIASEIFFVEQLSSEPSPQRNNSQNTLYSTELLMKHTREMPTLSSVTSPNQILSTLTTTPIT